MALSGLVEVPDHRVAMVERVGACRFASASCRKVCFVLERVVARFTVALRASVVDKVSTLVQVGPAALSNVTSQANNFARWSGSASPVSFLGAGARGGWGAGGCLRAELVGSACAGRLKEARYGVVAPISRCGGLCCAFFVLFSRSVCHSLISGGR